MKRFSRIVSALVSTALVILALQFDIGKTIIHHMGVLTATGTTTIVIYVAIDTLCEWWRDNVKNKKK